jgi:hypothetical protein
MRANFCRVKDVASVNGVGELLFRGLPYGKSTTGTKEYNDREKE